MQVLCPEDQLLPWQLQLPFKNQEDKAAQAQKSHEEQDKDNGDQGAQILEIFSETGEVKESKEFKMFHHDVFSMEQVHEDLEMQSYTS